MRIRVIQALYAYSKEEISLSAAEKNLAFTLSKNYELYALMLRLIVDVRRYAESQIEKGRKKKLPTAEDLNPNTQFVDNEVIAQLTSSDSLNDFLASHHLSWHRNGDLIRHLYTQLIESDYYQRYMAREAKYSDDLKVVLDFYKNTASDSDLLEEVIEEQSIGWNDATEYAIVSAVKSLERLYEGQRFVISEQYSNEDDAKFADELFLKIALNRDSYRTYVEQHATNWEVERIAQLDMIIMVAAICEFINFPSIPVKVTMDEYIEIAKYYSTPTSGQFINGILDKIVAALTEEGKINKSGRGLID